MKAVSVGYWVRRFWRACPVHSFSPESVHESLGTERSGLGEKAGTEVYKTPGTGESWKNRPGMELQGVCYGKQAGSQRELGPDDGPLGPAEAH